MSYIKYNKQILLDSVYDIRNFLKKPKLKELPSDDINHLLNFVEEYANSSDSIGQFVDLKLSNLTDRIEYLEREREK